MVLETSKHAHMLVVCQLLYMFDGSVGLLWGHLNLFIYSDFYLFLRSLHLRNFFWENKVIPPQFAVLWWINISIWGPNFINFVSCWSVRPYSENRKRFCHITDVFCVAFLLMFQLNHFPCVFGSRVNGLCYSYIRDNFFN